MTDLAHNVAIKVMGWHMVRHNNGRDYYYDQGERLQQVAHTWRPDDHMNEVWFVVERMRELGYGFRFHQNRGSAFAMFIRHEDWHRTCVIQPSPDDTAEVAICKAAIEAIERDFADDGKDKSANWDGYIAWQAARAQRLGRDDIGGYESTVGC